MLDASRPGDGLLSYYDHPLSTEIVYLQVAPVAASSASHLDLPACLFQHPISTLISAMQLKGYEVQVTCDNTPLPEYNVQLEGDDGKTVACYIPSECGKVRFPFLFVRQPRGEASRC